MEQPRQFGNTGNRPYICVYRHDLPFPNGSKFVLSKLAADADLQAVNDVNLSDIWADLKKVF
jgi:hypothetical protein